VVLLSWFTTLFLTRVVVWEFRWISMMTTSVAPRCLLGCLRHMPMDRACGRGTRSCRGTAA